LVLAEESDGGRGFLLFHNDNSTFNNTLKCYSDQRRLGRKKAKLMTGVGMQGSWHLFTVSELVGLKYRGSIGAKSHVVAYINAL